MLVHTYYCITRVLSRGRTLVLYHTRTILEVELGPVQESNATVRSHTSCIRCTYKSGVGGTLLLPSQVLLSSLEQAACGCSTSCLLPGLRASFVVSNCMPSLTTSDNFTYIQPTLLIYVRYKHVVNYFSQHRALMKLDMVNFSDTPECKVSLKLTISTPTAHFLEHRRLHRKKLISMQTTPLIF